MERTKTVVAFILDEIFASGIESAAIVIAPGTEKAFSSAVSNHLDKVVFIEQATPRGYGHAILCARDFTGNDPFLVMMGGPSLPFSCQRIVRPPAPEFRVPSKRASFCSTTNPRK